MRLADRMGSVAPSATLAAKQAAANLKARGVDVIDLGPGEPDFPSPPHAVSAAIAALNAGETHYSAGEGLPALRTALARALSARADGPLTAEGIVVTAGGKSALLYLMLALIEAGDEVVIPAPCWVSFPEQVRLAGGAPVLVPCPAERGFALRVEDLAAAISSRTRALIVNSPNNPTGAVVGPDTWREIADLARQRDVMLISDETYDAFIYDGAARAPSALPHARRLEGRLAVVGSFSKTYAMTGWRIGYVHAEAWLSRAIATLQSQDTSHPATFAQHGAVAALGGPAVTVEEMRAEYAARRALMLEGLARLPGFSIVPPEGAFYLFPDVRKAMAATGCADDLVFTRRLLEEAHVAVVAGSAFHGPGHVRISYAVSRERLREALERLARWLARASG